MSPRSITLLGVACGRGARVPGAEDGPYELRQRGLVERLRAAGRTVDDLGDVPGLFETRFASDFSPVHHLPNVLQVNRHTHACILGSRRKSPDNFLLVIGGDHSLAIGALAGLSDSCQRLGIVWIDAHADFNTPASSPTGNIHGMSLAVACGRGLLELRAIADRDPMVLEEDVFLLGPRDVDPGEREALRDSRVTTLDTAQWRRRGFAAAALEATAALAARCDHVHLSFDIDVMDASLVPGTGTPVPGGLSREEALDLLAALGQQGRIDSAEFVEYNPALDPAGATAELTIALIAGLLSS